MVFRLSDSQPRLRPRLSRRPLLRVASACSEVTAPRVMRGPVAGFHGLYAGQSSHERVSILLVLPGATVTLPVANVAAAR